MLSIYYFYLQTKPLSLKQTLFINLQLFHLVLEMALWEVLHIGQLEVYLSQPDKEALTGSLKLFSLAREMLNEKKRGLFMHK